MRASGNPKITCRVDERIESALIRVITYVLTTVLLLCRSKSQGSSEQTWWCDPKAALPEPKEDSYVDDELARWDPGDGEFIGKCQQTPEIITCWLIKTEEKGPEQWERTETSPYQWHKMLPQYKIDMPPKAQIKAIRSEYLALPPINDQMQYRLNSYKQSIHMQQLIQDGSPGVAT